MADDSGTTSSSTSSTSSTSSCMKTDFDAVVHVRYTTSDEKIDEEPVFAHRLVLSTFSPLFNELLSQETSSPSEDVTITPISLDLTVFPNAVAAFKVMLEALYTGDIKLTSATANEVLAVTRYCQVNGLEAKIMTAAATQLNLANLLQCSTSPHSPNPFLQYTTATTSPQNYLSNMINLWTNPFFSALFGGAAGPVALPFSSQSDTERTQSEGSSPRGANATPPTTDLEKIVPNDDKEGWCRNKKYIEKVDGGFMCTVCRKIYGRYNSVSYHVTIYHRNPPIKCEENGCNFSTREARYIHFHKYYRHHIPLPENIDLGSRKCPFCRHVSKSPAMLEKHIARHETEGTNSSPGSLKRAQKKKIITPNAIPDVISSSSSSSSASSSIFAAATATTPIKCSLCQFTTFGTDVLFMHLATTHTQELVQLGIGDTSSEASASTSSSSDGEPIADIDIDTKPLIDPTLMLPLNTPI